MYGWYRRLKLVASRFRLERFSHLRSAFISVFLSLLCVCKDRRRMQTSLELREGGKSIFYVMKINDLLFVYFLVIIWWYTNLFS